MFLQTNAANAQKNKITRDDNRRYNASISENLAQNRDDNLVNQLSEYHRTMDKLVNRALLEYHRTMDKLVNRGPGAFPYRRPEGLGPAWRLEEMIPKYFFPNTSSPKAGHRSIGVASVVPLKPELILNPDDEAGALKFEPRARWRDGEIKGPFLLLEDSFL
ncbi:hypothetical protein DY000_02022686 [Brassica cretica]|uniref:Uncharacterized protein n=1 Tax=Brassica cretica TaxID=69181 RepID=A0ABQ7EEG6_BRACR|nr:hypothetical protein DY000_02022686 [Brassica cretica]